jgi:hypothetical protein
MQLRCTRCGLAYDKAAIARQPLLATATTCRRCGGSLSESQHPRTAQSPRTVTAVRSAVAGEKRVPLT